MHANAAGATVLIRREQNSPPKRGGKYIKAAVQSERPAGPFCASFGVVASFAKPSSRLRGVCAETVFTLSLVADISFQRFAARLRLPPIQSARMSYYSSFEQGIYFH